MAENVVSKTSYKLFGNEKRPALILIHGLGLNKNMWKYQVDDLKENYFVVTYDLLGHGESGEPEKLANLSEFTDQIKGLVNHFELTHLGVIGFSLGGIIARHFAQRYSSDLTALVILNSPHTRTPEAQQAVQKRLMQVSAYGPIATVDDAIKRWFTSKFQREEKEKIALVRSWILANEKKLYSQNYRILVEGVKEVVGYNNNIECATLIMTSDQDYGNGPEMSHAISKEIPKSKLIILKGLRHMALFERPILVNKYLKEFLDSNLCCGELS